MYDEWQNSDPYCLLVRPDFLPYHFEMVGKNCFSVHKVGVQRHASLGKFEFSEYQKCWFLAFW